MFPLNKGDFWSIDVRRLTINDNKQLIDFFNLVIEEKLDQYFHPHKFTEEAAISILDKISNDWYFGVFICSTNFSKMIGYGMLRGWDEGYEIPSFGICILNNYQNMGIGKIIIDYAKLICRINKCSKIRLKVYPKNGRSLQIYRKNGFIFSGETQNDQLIGFLEL